MQRLMETTTTPETTTTELMRHLTDDFQSLVAAVAFVYVLCQLPMVVECICMTIGAATPGWIKTLNYTALVFNSTFNLPLYLLFSRKMRLTFFQMIEESLPLASVEGNNGDGGVAIGSGVGLGDVEKASTIGSGGFRLGRSSVKTAALAVADHDPHSI